MVLYECQMTIFNFQIWHSFLIHFKRPSPSVYECLFIVVFVIAQNALLMLSEIMKVIIYNYM